MDVPFLTLFLQLLIHVDGAGLGRPAHAELHGHDRQPQHHQAQHIQQHKAAPAVLAAHPREFPHIAAADGAPGGQQDEPQPGPQLLAFHIVSPSAFLFTLVWSYPIKYSALRQEMIKFSQYFRCFPFPGSLASLN